MKKLYGIDMEKTQRSKLLSALPPIDIAITMGCSVQCPSLPCQKRDDRGFEDPTGKDDAAFIETIKTIEEKIWLLTKELSE